MLLEYEEILNKSKIANQNGSEEKWTTYFENKRAILEQQYKDKLDQIKASQVDEQKHQSVE